MSGSERLSSPTVPLTPAECHLNKKATGGKKDTPSEVIRAQQHGCADLGFYKAVSAISTPHDRDAFCAGLNGPEWVRLGNKSRAPIKREAGKRAARHGLALAAEQAAGQKLPSLINEPIKLNTWSYVLSSHQQATYPGTLIKTLRICFGCGRRRPSYPT
jgi:hypothetical protein